MTTEQLPKLYLRAESLKTLNARLRAGMQVLGARDGQPVALDAQLPHKTPIVLIDCGEVVKNGYWNAAKGLVE